MKTLYIQCNMGCAGDMLMSALSELLPNKDEFFQKLNKIGLKDVVYESKAVERCGITGTLTDVKINGEIEESTDNDHNHEHSHHHHDHHHHEHSNMKSITEIINGLNIPEKVKNDAIEVYNIIADAESKVHNKHVDMIHFHEVGNKDAIADIVGVSYIMYELDVDNICCSNINVGSGTVKCAHGILPVPAPATALIMKGMPVYSNDVVGELCTPTGAALLKYFVNEYKPMPTIEIEKIGYGMGHKEFETANCVRAILGNTQEEKTDTITKLECNIDDMTGEEISFAEEMLFSAGARDVFTVPIYMKKNRPAVILTCLCVERDKNKIVETIFKYTSTIGVRESIMNRYILERKIEEKNTKLGTIQVKKSFGYGCEKEKIEYSTLSELATKNDMSISQVKKIISEDK
jgi:uncharacterized protein (TIGR00299 family) protein